MKSPKTAGIFLDLLLNKSSPLLLTRIKRWKTLVARAEACAARHAGREPACMGYTAAGRSRGKRLRGIKYLMRKVYFSLSQSGITAPPDCRWSKEQPLLVLCWFCTWVSLGAAAVAFLCHPQHVPGWGGRGGCSPAAHPAYVHVLGLLIPFEGTKKLDAEGFVPRHPFPLAEGQGAFCRRLRQCLGSRRYSVLTEMLTGQTVLFECCFFAFARAPWTLFPPAAPLAFISFKSSKQILSLHLLHLWE